MKAEKRIAGRVEVWSGEGCGMGWAYKIEGGPHDGRRSTNKYRTRSEALGAGRAFKKFRSMLDHAEANND